MTATLVCSFCGKTQHEAAHIIVGPAVCICDECVELCLDLLTTPPREGSPPSGDPK